MSTATTSQAPVRASYDSVTQLIGDTPLVRLHHLGLPAGLRLFAKLEFYNPGGSVKDRVALAMIEDAEQTGRLVPGSVIVEGTAGNMGLGIAVAALGRGYRVIFVVPTKFSQEKQVLMRALGAEVINTPREEGMQGACRKADELITQLPNALSLGQFVNPVNPEAHYRGTGPEIFEALGGELDYLVAGAGSGGTYSGIMRYLKEQNMGIQGVLADPLGSTIGGGEHGDYDIEGIGNDFVPATMDLSLVDEVIKVTDTDALATVRELALKEGLIVGSSSGAAVWASLELARRLAAHELEVREASASDDHSDDHSAAHPAGRPTDRSANRPITIVTVLPDRGDRYFSKGLYE